MLYKFISLLLIQDFLGGHTRNSDGLSEDEEVKWVRGMGEGLKESEKV